MKFTPPNSCDGDINSDFMSLEFTMSPKHEFGDIEKPSPEKMKKPQNIVDKSIVVIYNVCIV